MLLLVTFSSLANAGEQTVETFTLKNGLQVIVLPNHRIPAVNHMIWYRVGASDDPAGKSGLAHYHEHLMFKGSPHFGSGEFVRLVTKNGGEHNAFTGRDLTSYYVAIAKDRLPLAMELEADRMRGITASEAESISERQVIFEERRSRVGNNPDALMDEKRDATLFTQHPYHNPIIGWPQELDGLTLKDALAFHEKYYHPNNAVLIVSGDITAAELKPLAEKYYGTLPAGKIPKREWIGAKPGKPSEAKVTLHHKHVKQPEFTRSYVAPSMGYGDKSLGLPTFVLSYLLGGGKNSVLYKTLVVERKLAAGVNIGYDMYARGPATFTIEITPEKDVNLETIEKALDEELAAFLEKGADSESLGRGKKLLMAEGIYSREGLTSLSNIMGWIIMSGLPPEYFNEWAGKIEAVDATQILAAAKTILKPESSVTGYLLPEEKK